MYLNLNAILLGAAVVTAAPFPSAHWTNGSVFPNDTSEVLDWSMESAMQDLMDAMNDTVFPNGTSELLDWSMESAMQDLMDSINDIVFPNGTSEVLDWSMESAMQDLMDSMNDTVFPNGTSELLDWSMESAMQDLMDSINDIVFPNVTSEGATGGYAVGGDDKVFSRSAKGCNFTGFEECKASGRGGCGKELYKHGECTIAEFHDYLLGRGHKNEKRPIPKRPVSGNQTDSDADVFFNNAKGCDFKPYEECKARGSNHNDCIKELIKHGECKNWEILHKHLTESPKRVDGDWAVDGDGKLIITNSTVSEDATRDIVIDDRYGKVVDGKIVYSDDA